MTSKQPNLILITTDQQRYDAAGINGSAFLSTPNLDRLGREGARFTRPYCPNAVCTPSRVSLMTGWHLSRHGSYNIGVHPLGYDGYLSTRLTRAGYRTHHIGKAHWHPWDDPKSKEYGALPPETFDAPARGFTGFETAELVMGHAGYCFTGHYGRWIGRKGHAPGDFPIEYAFEGDPNGTGEWGLPTVLHPGTWLAERAVAFLETRDLDRPFYLNLGFPDPHHPHLLPKDYARRVDPASAPLPDADLSRERNPAPHLAAFRDGTLQDSRFRGRFEMAGQGRAAWEDYWNDPERARATRAHYYGMVHLIDDQLGIILDALEEHRIVNDTLVVFTSDHGEMLGDHGIGQKGPIAFDGVLKVPFLMNYPDGIAPQTVDECVSLVDVLPTLLDFAGVPDPLRRDGISLKPRLTGEAARLPRPGVRVEYKEEPDRIRYKAWVTPEAKLAVYGDEEWGEFYDIANDPGEWDNRFDDPGLAPVRERLLKEMLADMERSEPLGERNSRV